MGRKNTQGLTRGGGGKFEKSSPDVGADTALSPVPAQFGSFKEPGWRTQVPRKGGCGRIDQGPDVQPQLSPPIPSPATSPPLFHMSWGISAEAPSACRGSAHCLAWPPGNTQTRG